MHQSCRRCGFDNQRSLAATRWPSALYGKLMSERSVESPYQAIPGEERGRSRSLPVVLIVTLILISVLLVPVALPVIGFFGPLLLERTIRVSSCTLDQLPARFHPHFSPNAVDISGEYSSATRKCTFKYSCTREDFEAMIQRENLPRASESTLEEGLLSTGRQWGPGVASYQYFPNSQTATVAASAW